MSVNPSPYAIARLGRMVERRQLAINIFVFMNDQEKKERREKLMDIALFLEGMKQAKGDLLPLGTLHLDALWAVIQSLETR